MNFHKVIFFIIAFGQTVLLPTPLRHKEYRTQDEKKAFFEALFVEYIDTPIPSPELKQFKNTHIFPIVSLNNVPCKSSLSREKYIKYLQERIARRYMTPTSIKHVSEKIGHGVFSQRELHKNEFIGEYTGEIVRDGHNNEYAWDYPMHSSVNIDFRSKFSINGESYGNELRFINDDGQHSNCHCQVVRGKDNINHVVYVAKKDIAVGEQLTISYGAGYWATRKFQALTLEK